MLYPVQIIIRASWTGNNVPGKPSFPKALSRVTAFAIYYNYCLGVVCHQWRWEVLSKLSF